MTDLVVDIDEPWVLLVSLRRAVRLGFYTGEIRETEKGYHIRLPVNCTADNFIYCLVIRRYLWDDPSRIVGDFKRLMECEDPKDIMLYINRYFEFKVKNGFIVNKQKFRSVDFLQLLSRYQ